MSNALHLRSHPRRIISSISCEETGTESVVVPNEAALVCLAAETRCEDMPFESKTLICESMHTLGALMPSEARFDHLAPQPNRIFPPLDHQLVLTLL